MKLGIVTCARISTLLDSDKELVNLFINQGIDCEPVVWNDEDVNWSSFDFLIIRSTWDYYLEFEAFEKWLILIKTLEITIFNSIEIITENFHKFYLKNLQQKGVEIIPTIFIKKSEKLDLSFIQDLDWNEIIIKPAISAGSYKTEKFLKQNYSIINQEYIELNKTTDLLLQKFMPEIQTHGEVSLIFFDGIYSHAILKVPKKDDFRVQFQFGGVYQNYLPSTIIKKKAEEILQFYPKMPTYARIDGLIIDEKFYLMEVELIEPDLYFNLVPEAREKFVNCIVQKILYERP